MGGYLVNFGVYAMAMTGLIFFALMVYKKFAAGGSFLNSKTKNLQVEETLSLAPRKTLYVVKAGQERFLIAGDVDKTTLISKLDTLNDTGLSGQYMPDEPDLIQRPQTIKKNNLQNKKEFAYSLNNGYTKNKEAGIYDLPNIVNYEHKAGQKNILQNMIRKINE